MHFLIDVTTLLFELSGIFELVGIIGWIVDVSIIGKLGVGTIIDESHVLLYVLLTNVFLSTLVCCKYESRGNIFVEGKTLNVDMSSMIAFEFGSVSNNGVGEDSTNSLCGVIVDSTLTEIVE